ncbi:TPA: hypothetical protein QDC55_000005 [Burkholderia cenocepacia]|uniref:hypothetical protein n=1 Tax=Burkholderia orbicola TaxID=2978683 RepID=UPI0029898241|nr:hypothetical protein [Burkholderia cenocepacia]HDR9809220.1 hypothetical protein [Burkholderia cenocepacia]HDR9815869.1 hypothetical protein [Burkholderia cenocepacia]HDR9826509.1 hypothetical protein [Burkholderia cenocepacia]
MTINANAHQIRTEAAYKVALRRVSTLVDLDPAPGTPQGDELESLVILVERYESAYILKKCVAAGSASALA